MSAWGLPRLSRLLLRAVLGVKIAEAAAGELVLLAVAVAMLWNEAPASSMFGTVRPSISWVVRLASM